MKHRSKQLVGILLITITLLLSGSSSAFAAANQTTLWPDQCIDTMKQSRDAARGWITNATYKNDIAREMAAVKNMGATCVAIGTPYDEEFIPYLTAWVQAARAQHLHVWFRGNFSSWEGWFNYPKGMKPQDQLDKTKAFILAHPDLFQDGDIFTPAPEAENGWNNGSGVSSNDHAAFRQFLSDEQSYSQDAFRQIGKNLETNWLSMSGGVAKDIMTQATIDGMGGTITIDHYVASPAVMDEYIDYFHNTFHANFILGEFGAPIPDLNGDMNEMQQAAFVDSIFKELYKKRAIIHGVNYWVIADGSTELLNTDGTPRKVVDVIKKYYIPAVISGKVTNTVGEPISNITVRTADNAAEVKTDQQGNYTILVPAETTILDFEHSNYKSAAREITITKGGNFTQNISLDPYTANWFYNLELNIKGFIENTILQIKSWFHK